MRKIDEFEQKCFEAWGKSERDVGQLFDISNPKIKDIVDDDFQRLSCHLKLHIALKIINESLYNAGTIVDSGDLNWYIRNFAEDIKWSCNSFDYRRSIPLKSALFLLISNTSQSEFSKRSHIDHILAGGIMPATLYLVSQLEYLLRKNSRYLDTDGKVIKEIPPQLQKKTIPKYQVGTRKRVNRINDAFVMYTYRNQSLTARTLKHLDSKLLISKRLDKSRNRIMHGELTVTAEGYLCALIISMFYYSQNKE